MDAVTQKAWFLDTSALAKRYVREPGTDRVLSLFLEAPPERLGIARLTLLEMRSLFHMAQAARRLTAEDAARAWTAFRDEWDRRLSIQEIEIDVWALGLELVSTHALRPADALQLAAALTWKNDGRIGELVFVCADRGLLQAAVKENLTGLDPAD